MNSTVKERLILFIKSMKISQSKFEKSVGLSNGFVNNISKGIGAEKLHRILCVYPALNAEWLLTGKGEMLLNEKNSNSGQNFGSIGGDNKSSYTNVGNTVNVSLPESGTQKIIRPDGTVEIQKIGSDVESIIRQPNEEIRLNQRIQDLERIIQEKDAVIKSKDELICLYKKMCPTCD